MKMEKKDKIGFALGYSGIIAISVVLALEVEHGIYWMHELALGSALVFVCVICYQQFKRTRKRKT